MSLITYFYRSSSTLKVRPSIRWFHILSFTTLPSLKMGALPPWNPGGRFNQARCRGRSYPSASPLIQFKEHQLIIAVLHELPTEPITQVFIPLHDVKKSLCQATAAKCAGTPASFFQPTPADRMQS